MPSKINTTQAVSKDTLTQKPTIKSTTSQHCFNKRAQTQAMAMAKPYSRNSNRLNMSSPKPQPKEKPPKNSVQLISKNITISSGAHSLLGNERSKMNDSTDKSLALARTPNNGIHRVLRNTNGKPNVSNTLPILSSKESIPDENDRCYFCRVCRKRSASKSNYYHHLRDHHHLSLKSQDKWRINDLDIIPSEFDTSLCCIKCQKVHATETSYRYHLEKYHHVNIPDHETHKRKMREEAMFSRDPNYEFQMTRLEREKGNYYYACTICESLRTSLVNLSHHYFVKHNIIAEFYNAHTKPKVPTVSKEAKKEEPQFTTSQDKTKQSTSKGLVNQIQQPKPKAKQSTSKDLVNQIQQSKPKALPIFHRRHPSRIRMNAARLSVTDLTTKVSTPKALHSNAPFDKEIPPILDKDIRPGKRKRDVLFAETVKEIDLSKPADQISKRRKLKQI